MSADLPEKQARILDAALHIFREQGFHEARIEDIAAAAAVGKGTIYEYFSNKTELFEQTITYHMGRVWQAAEDYVSKGKSAKEKIQRILESEVKLLTEEDDLVYVLVQDPGPVSMDLRKWLWRQRGEVILDSIGEIVKQGIIEGTIRKVDPRIAASVVFMAFHAFMVLRMSAAGEPGAAGSQGDIEAITDLVFKGIGAG